MQLNSTILFIVWLASAAHASGNLRARRDLDNAEEEERESGLLDPFVHTKETPDGSRLLERGHGIMTTSEQHDERKKQTTREKHEKMNAVFGESELLEPDSPYHELTLKEPRESIVENTEPNSHFEINIVGGDISDASEFPYFGTLYQCFY